MTERYGKTGGQRFVVCVGVYSLDLNVADRRRVSSWTRRQDACRDHWRHWLAHSCQKNAAAHGSVERGTSAAVRNDLFQVYLIPPWDHLATTFWPWPWWTLKTLDMWSKWFEDHRFEDHLQVIDIACWDYTKNAFHGFFSHVNRHDYYILLYTGSSG